MTPKTLLEKAMAEPTRQRTDQPMTDELADLIVAFMNGEITGNQAGKAMGGRLPQNFTNSSGLWLRGLVTSKKVKVSRL